MFYSQWRKLPLSTRALLAKQFGFSKTGPTHVVDNRVEADGYKFEDVERAITRATMEEYIGFPVNDLEVLWCYMVDKIEGRPYNIQVTDEAITFQAMTTFPPVENVVETSPTVIPKEPHETEHLKPPFCTFCDSKGVRHKKICTRPQ